MPYKKKTADQKKTKTSYSKNAPASSMRPVKFATERDEKAGDLQRAGKDWQQTFDAIPHFVALISPDFEFIRLNRAGYQSLGKKLEEVIGKRCCGIVHGQDAPMEGCPCMRSIRTKKPELGELTMGGRHYIATASPVLGENGELLSFVHTIRDITERKRSEEELRRYREQLEELVKERTTELRTANEQLQAEITERKRAEEEIQRSCHIQSILDELLRISLKNTTMEEMLERIINRIFSIPWFELESKGVIFLVEDEPGVLVMKAQRGLERLFQTICNKVPFGRCLCGRAAESGQIEFADRITERHQNQYERMPAHGHYCVPIISSDKKVLGVITLFLKEGHRRDEKEEEFLRAAANVLAGILERRRAEEMILETDEQLKIEREALERKNIALREVLNQIDAEKNTLKRRLTTNVEQAILPTLLRLKKSSRPSQLPIFEMLEKDLREIVSPFLDTLQSKYAKLSPRELEICRLVKDGMTSKEIAEALNLSLWTVYKYRELIRKKLDLVKDGTNLQNYLRSL